jgi:hypothetical protein
MNVYEQQRDILFEACKKIATAPNCPKWIADILRTEVMRAKQIKEDFPELKEAQEVPQEGQQLEVGSVVVITNNGQSCVAKLTKEAIPVDGVRLFDVQVVENTPNHSIGQTFFNIPETLMKRK